MAQTDQRSFALAGFPPPLASTFQNVASMSFDGKSTAESSTRSGKEGRSRSPFGESKESKESKNELDTAFMAAFERNSKEMEHALTAAVSEGIKEPIQKTVLEVCRSQFNAIDERMGKLEQSQGRMVDDIAEIKGILGKMSLQRTSSQPELGVSPPMYDMDNGAAEVTTSTFFRRVDPTVLFVNVHGQVEVPKKEMVTAFSKLAGEANIADDQFEFFGDELGSKFEVKFRGDFRTGAAAAGQFLLSLRLGPQKYKEQKCKDPSGTPCAFYVNPDKNGAQIRKEVQAKLLKGILEAEKPGLQFFLKRDAGVIFVDRKPIASVVVISETRSRVSWNHPHRLLKGVDDAVVTEKFQSAAANGGVQWS